MSWTDLISIMEPLKAYYIDNLMQLSDKGSREVLKAIRDAGEHVEKPLGMFRLSHKGEQFKKQLNNESQTTGRNAKRGERSKL